MVGRASLVIWLLQDGKAGHQNQVLALIEALQQRLSLSVELVRMPARAMPGLRWLHVLVFSRDLVQPDLMVGAGHATHGALLILSRLRRVPSLVVMRPSLPVGWFSRVVAPSHDLEGLAPSPNLLASFGPLCRCLVPATDSSSCNPGGSVHTAAAPHTLVLLGGPSRHYQFELARLEAQLVPLLAADPDPDGWCLVDSRRTPPGALQQLGLALGLPPRQLMPWRQCPPGWLAAELARRLRVWVSEDSLSMLFEAVSAGCRVGVLPMARCRRSSRQQATLDRLVAEDYVLPLTPGQPLPDLGCFQPPPPLAEAQRLAELLLPWLQGLRR
jgi:mitochondrial fission protein ELM1